MLLPGGLEPLDPNVFRDPEAASLCSSSEDEGGGGLLDGGGSNAGGGGGGFVQPRGMAAAKSSATLDGLGVAGNAAVPWAPPRIAPWPVCPAQTTAPQAVTFRFSYLRAGTHTVRFKAVAATSGTFVLPPAKAYVRQQPEVMGLSAAGQLVVCGKATGGCTSAGGSGAGGGSTAAAAKGCPGDCNGNGACNLVTGACICNAGFSGAGCGVF